MNDTEREKKIIIIVLKRDFVVVGVRCRHFFFAFPIISEVVGKSDDENLRMAWAAVFAWTLYAHGRLNSNEKIKISEMRKQVLQRVVVFDAVVTEPKIMNSTHTHAHNWKQMSACSLEIAIWTKKKSFCFSLSLRWVNVCARFISIQSILVCF